MLTDRKKQITGVVVDRYPFEGIICPGDIHDCGYRSVCRDLSDSAIVRFGNVHVAFGVHHNRHDVVERSEQRVGVIGRCTSISPGSGIGRHVPESQCRHIRSRRRQIGDGGVCLVNLRTAVRNSRGLCNSLSGLPAK